MRGLRLLAGLLIGVYFFLLTRAALDGWFTPDDTTNLYRAWSFPPGWLVRANLLFWETSPFYRPIPAVWYRSLYSLAGLRPLPFHVTNLIILGGNIFLTYAVARRLSESREVGALTALLGCYHPGFANLYFDTGFIFDVFCYFFYFAALLIYLRTRQSGRLPCGWPLAGTAALFLCALNSKEMAVTLPLLLAIYEWLYHPPRAWTRQELRRWLAAEGRGALILGAIALVYTVGRTTGADSLSKAPGYQMIFTWPQFVKSGGRFLGDLAFRPEPLNAAVTILVWMVLFTIALESKSRLLRFAWLFLILSVLPIAFTSSRGAPQSYIALFGWSLFAASVLVSASKWLVRRFFAPGTRLAVSRPQIVFVAVLTLLFALYQSMGWSVPSVSLEGAVLRQVSTQLRGLRPTLQPRTKLLFLNDPVKLESFDLLFLVRLTYRDDSLIVDRVKTMPARPRDGQLAEYGGVFDYRSGRLMELTRPWRQRAMPVIVLGPEGDEVFHRNWGRVTSRRAAKPGEMLIARVTDLGATEPAVPPDRPFPRKPFAHVTSQVEVRINGRQTELGGLIGWPEEVNQYRLDFRVPPGTAPGAAKVEISANGATGPVTEIPVQ